MHTISTLRAANSKGQFILPAIPVGISPALVDMIEEYLIGCWAVDDGALPRWEAATRQIHVFEPTSLTDLAAKMIIAIHYRDPNRDGQQLAIRAPEPEADRLAVELELAVLDWLLVKANSAPSNHNTWAAAEAAYARADADLEALPEPYTDTEMDRLADIRGKAIDAILDLPATTTAQAIRKLELAMFDEQMVRTGVDFPALLADAKRLAEDL